MRVWIVTLSIGLLSTACAPSPYQNVPPECEGNRTLSIATGGKLGRADEAACRAAIMRQGGPMSIMKSPEQLERELGGSPEPPEEQKMPPMTPEQMQQMQQLMQQMQTGQPRQPVQQRTPLQQPPPSPQQPAPMMTPEQQELMRQQMLQQAPASAK
jgi:hypothetical protein